MGDDAGELLNSITRWCWKILVDVDANGYLHCNVLQGVVLYTIVHITVLCTICSLQQIVLPILNSVQVHCSHDCACCGRHHGRGRPDLVGCQPDCSLAHTIHFCAGRRRFVPVWVLQSIICTHSYPQMSPTTPSSARSTSQAPPAYPKTPFPVSTPQPCNTSALYQP